MINKYLLIFSNIKMGSNTRQKTSVNQTIATNIVQVSTAYCQISIDNNFNNNNIIVIGNSGDLDFSQRATIDNSTCDMSSSLDTEIENIIESMLGQSASAQNGLTLDFTNISQNTSIYQTIQNSMTQMMSSTCNITESNNRNNNYIYLEDNSGNLDFSQTASITGSSCNMSNIAKTTSYNSNSTESSQTAKLSNVFGLMFGIIGLCMVLGIIILIVAVVGGGGDENESSTSANITSGISSTVVNQALTDYQKSLIL